MRRKHSAIKRTSADHATIVDVSVRVAGQQRPSHVHEEHGTRWRRRAILRVLPIEGEGTRTATHHSLRDRQRARRSGVGRQAVIGRCLSHMTPLLLIRKGQPVVEQRLRRARDTSREGRRHKACIGEEGRRTSPAVDVRRRGRRKGNRDHESPTRVGDVDDPMRRCFDHAVVDVMLETKVIAHVPRGIEVGRAVRQH